MAKVLSRASLEFGTIQHVFGPEWLEAAEAESPPSLSSAIASLEAASLNLIATSAALSTAIQPFTYTYTYTQIRKTPKQKRKTRRTTSKYFEPFSMEPTPQGLDFPLSPSHFGLIQERIRSNLWALVVQTILWNKTTAKAGRPVLFELLSNYHTPLEMSLADINHVMAIIGCLGLQHKRSNLLIDLAKKWLEAPPHPSRRYAKKDYPKSGDNANLKNKVMVEEDDLSPSFEITHLPGVGPYAIDSYRIFYRDTLRGFGVDPHEVYEPEWKRVLPQDKDLRAYLVWKWRSIGWDWNPLNGERQRIVAETT